MDFFLPLFSMAFFFDFMLSKVVVKSCVFFFLYVSDKYLCSQSTCKGDRNEQRKSRTDNREKGMQKKTQVRNDRNSNN